MKFLQYFALIATTTAVRLQSTTETETEANLYASIELEKNIPNPEEIWKEFDKNGDNAWDLQEAQSAFKSAMKHFGRQLPKGWKKMVKEQFEKFDTNKNGKVDHMEMLTGLFKMIDENGDGKWQLCEVFLAIQKLAQLSKNKLIKGWQEKVTEAFKHVDTDKDGGASPKEIFAALEKHGVPDINDLFVQDGQKIDIDNLIFLDKRVPTPDEIWKMYDTDKNGKWSFKETLAAFKSIMKYFGHPIPKGWKKMVKAEFKKADKDGSGEVCKDEIMLYIFELVDSNGDGAWDLGEVEQAIQDIARLSKNTLKSGWQNIVKGVFDSVDKNSDGKASPKEILLALKNHGIPDINDLFN